MYVLFFKCSLNRRAVTLILELDEGNVSTLVKFVYQSSSFKYDFPSPLYKVRRPSDLEVKFMLKCDQSSWRNGRG